MHFKVAGLQSEKKTSMQTRDHQSTLVSLSLLRIKRYDRETGKSTKMNEQIESVHWANAEKDTIERLKDGHHKYGLSSSQPQPKFSQI